MQITKIERFKFNGVEYKSLKDVKTHVENEIGKLIDKASQSMQAPLTPKQALTLFDFIVTNKEDIKSLLSVEYDKEPDDWQDQQTTNILDLDV